MEEVNCPLCDSGIYHTILTSIDIKTSKKLFNIVECIKCGFKFTNPRPSFQEMAFYYGNDYYSYRPLNHKLQSLRYDKAKKYLDIGCGSGKHLIKKNYEGYDVYGVEVSENAIALGSAMGLKIFRADPNGKLPFEDNFFDEINLNHSLEHLHILHGTIAECFRCLKLGGSIKIGVPNIDAYEAKNYGQFWRQLDLPRHLNHFNPRTAMKLLKMNGFSNIKYKTFNIPLFDEELNYLKSRYTTLKIYICLNQGSLMRRIVNGFWKVFINTLRYPFHNGVNDGIDLVVTGTKE